MKIIIDNTNNNIEKELHTIEMQLYDYAPYKKRLISAALIATEEILLIYKNKMSSVEATIKVQKNIKELYVAIMVKGSSISPLEAEREENIAILDGLLQNTGIEINYKYEKGCNCISILIEKYSPALGNLAFCLKYVGKNRLLLARGEATQIVSMIANLIIPLLTAKLIVHYTDNVWTQIVVMSLSILLARIIQSVAINIANISYNKVFYRIRSNLETDLSKDILAVKDECFDENGTGTFINRITNDVTTISTGMNTIFDMATEMVYYVGILVMTAFIDPIVFLIEVLSIVLLSIIEHFRGNNFDNDSRSVNSSEEKRSSLIVDIINGQSDIKLLDGIGFFKNKMSAYAEEAGKKNERRVIRSRTTMILSESTAAICYCSVMLLLGYFLKIQRNDLATTLVLFNYFTLIGQPFILLVQRFVDFVKSFNLACERIRNLQNGSEFAKESYGDKKLETINGKITLQNVVFAYNHDNLLEDDKVIIDNVSLTINPGETVAFCGKSGAGKSTLFKLISGQRVASFGKVMIDEICIDELDKESIRNNIMVVSQSPYFFNTTIMENLLIANPDATFEMIEKACELACIKDDIEKMDDGYETLLGERGVRLSGGQKQRLAIARGLLRDAKIILFDEATSAIDNVTQASIIKTIEGLSHDHTIVMIAHRLSTIKNADRIILIDDGKVAADGKHSELLDSCEKYRALYMAEKE